MRRSKNLPADFTLFLTTILLFGVGILMVFDASFALADDGSDSWFYVKRQLGFGVIGLCAMFAAMRFRLEVLRRVSLLLVIFSIVLLIAVMVPGVGARANGATRWFEVGPIRFQPSEIAKFAVALYLAALFSSRKFRVRKILPGIIVPMIPVGIIGALVLAQPDMGTASVIMINAFIMLLVAGALKRHLVVLAGAGVGLAGLLVVVAPYRLARLLTFLNPMEDYYGRGYQVVHSLVALASGGLLGQGLCEGREKFYLPAAQTDFIFPATVGEEAGLLGSLAVVALFVIFTYRGLSIANRAKSPYYTLLAAGLTSMVSVQAAINILVVTSSMPATGVPLPFMSYGGTALIFALTTAGLLLNISRKAHVTPEDLGGKDEDYLDRRRDGRTYISRPQYSRRSTVRKPRSRVTVRR